MYRKILILLLFITLFLAACSNETFTYSGESANWSANFTVMQDSFDYETQELVLEYKSNDVNSVGEINYLVDSVGSFGEGDVTLEEDGTIRNKSEANPTNAQVNENTEVEVTVEWNGNTETFKLSRQ